MKTTRRNFIKKTGFGLAGAYFGSSLLQACTVSKQKGDGPFANIGLQIYSLRDLLIQDPKLTLQTVAKIGYSHIETFGIDLTNNTFWGLSIPELKKIMADTDLKTYSGHYDMSKYLSRHHTVDKEDIEKYIETAHELGQKYVIAPVTPMEDLNNLTVEDYQYAAEQLNKAGELAKKAGINIGYHNHFWEFRNFANGTKGLDIMIAFTEPELVSFELDIYWIEKSGLNPQSYFQKYPGRFPMWHIKDMDKNYAEPIVGKDFDSLPFDSIQNQVRFTEVGSGHIDYINIVQGAKQAGLEFAFVEQDDIYLPNKFESVKKSYEYVQKFLTK
ncbi:sugar phosphate isomerase/epimerase family protein [Sphingobacterium faecale]|uniref:Sugar phosphate isomerase/epimerase n=1 Tax=Sphingobacterium faecale TaxID=2803775 RepID=A0ABS1QZM5_9SPHI|nr:sugar phosphate isomerase/epimerase [Sphingobacterium faecale]MBL1407897.1 sugar phosphate isomerase/epimerase [Sphingobacterium faecale]